MSGDGYLTIGDYTPVPVMLSGARYRMDSIGSVRRAFSGVPRSSVRAYFRVWEGVETTWISRATADAIEAALLTIPEVLISGDMAGSITVLVQNFRRVDSGKMVFSDGLGEGVRLAFDLWETTASA